jgi:hypothetical protein
MSAPFWEPLAASPQQPPIVTVGTTLPASPTDTQEAILVDSLTNPTYQWRFRYNANSTSPYKWEFIGGPPLLGWSATSVTNGATLGAWVNMVGTAVILPRSGEYQIDGGCTVSHPSGGATSYASIWAGNASNVLAYSNFGFPSAGGFSGSIYVPPQKWNLTAGNAVGMGGQSNFANGAWSFLGWRMLPVRCS